MLHPARSVGFVMTSPEQRDVPEDCQRLAKVEAALGLRPASTRILRLERVAHSELHRARRADTGQLIEQRARALVEGVGEIVTIREVVQLPVKAEPASRRT